MQLQTHTKQIPGIWLTDSLMECPRPRMSKFWDMVRIGSRKLRLERPDFETPSKRVKCSLPLEESKRTSLGELAPEPLRLEERLTELEQWLPSSSLAISNNPINRESIEELPDAMVCCIASFLAVADLWSFSKTNCRFNKLSRTNQAGWEHHCRRLWHHKVHVLQKDRRHFSRMTAFFDSIADAQQRQHVTKSELVYDALTHQGVVWSFRFKESAGVNWTRTDPWYSGEPCRRFVFLGNGNVLEYHENRNNCTPTLRRPTFTSSLLNDHGNQESNGTPDAGIHMQWRFVHRPMDLPDRTEIGSYIRLTVAGKEVPTYAVHRSPTRNWGFVMESCWGVYASFELPPSQKYMRRGLRTRNARHFSADLSSQTRACKVGVSALEQQQLHSLEDKDLDLTSEVQWREAFLYNVGAVTLPEGDEDDATYRFDRAYAAL